MKHEVSDGLRLLVPPLTKGEEGGFFNQGSQESGDRREEMESLSSFSLLFTSHPSPFTPYGEDTRGFRKKGYDRAVARWKYIDQSEVLLWARQC